MHTCPETPTLDDTVEFSGHVWIQELPTGGEFRFQVAQSGLVTFATADGSFESVTAVPVAFRRAAQLTRRGFRRRRGATVLPRVS